jgi:hypothetical protein
MAVFWIVTPCILVEKFTDVLEVLAASIIIALMTKAASTSEASVNFYQTTQRNKTENSHLHTRRRENLKCHHKCYFFKHDLKCSRPPFVNNYFVLLCS